MSTPDAVATPLMWASRALNEAVMGFLALVALATAIGPLVFDVSAATDNWLTVVEWVVLALFVTEFGVQCAVATDRSEWLRSPWRIVDAVCIVGPLLSLLPQVSDALRGALVFRFLRVGRAVAFGARASALAVQKRSESLPTRHHGHTEVTVVKPGEEVSQGGSSWAELLAWSRTPSLAWYHASNVDRDKFLQLVALASIPDQDVAHFLDPESQPRIKNGHGLTSISVWLPTVAESGFPAVSRNRLLAVVSDTALLTATWHPFDLPDTVTIPTAAHATVVNVSFPMRMTYGLLALGKSVV